MIDITFEINGRKVDPNRIGDALERALFTQVRTNLAKKIAAVRDPDTGERPRLTVRGHSLRDLTIEVSGSETLIEEVTRRLKS
jgi:hypothetical protein